MPFLLALLLIAASFWEAKPPAEWSDLEVSQLFSESPWAQPIRAKIDGKTKGPTAHLMMPPVQGYLASARPLQLAAQERDRRAKAKAKGKEDEYDPFAEEYLAWLESTSKAHVIVAVRVAKATAYSDSKELALMKNSFIKVGGRKYSMTSYFPPSSHDPFLKIAFPRQVQLSDKKVEFELYVPGVAGPYRMGEFLLEPMVVAGKLEL
jgi:hypothetical protein